MSGYGYRDAVLQLDAALWRKRVRANRKTNPWSFLSQQTA